MHIVFYFLWPSCFGLIWVEVEFVFYGCGNFGRSKKTKVVVVILEVLKVILFYGAGNFGVGFKWMES